MTDITQKAKVIRETRKKVIKSIASYNQSLTSNNSCERISFSSIIGCFTLFYVILSGDTSLLGLVKALFCGGLTAIFLIVVTSKKAAAYGREHDDTGIIYLDSISSNDSVTLSELYDQQSPSFHNAAPSCQVEKFAPIVIEHLKLLSSVRKYSREIENM